MINYITGERMKHKRTFYKKLTWIMPFMCMLTALLLMAGNYVQSAGYNWWYMLFLPFTLTYVGGAMISREKKYNFHGMFTLADDKKKLWYAKVVEGTVVLTELSGLFFVLMLLCSFFVSPEISIGENVMATILLFLTFAWQVPFFMYFTLKSNIFFATVISIFSNFGIACFLAEGSLWWIPFAIPARLMCYAIRVRPNGLVIAQTEILKDTGVIGIGVGICVVLYIVVTIVTAKLFEVWE